jgi:tetratricopeptide (TPR) repeat protein
MRKTTILLLALLSIGTAFGQKAMEYYDKGMMAMDGQHYDSALIYFNKAVKSDPYNMFTLRERAILKVKMDDIPGAIKDYDAAIDISYGLMSDLYVERGNLKRRMKDYKGAIEDYSLAISKKPDNGEYYFRRAFVWQDQERTDSACVDFKRAVDRGYEPAQFMNSKCH